MKSVRQALLYPLRGENGKRRVIIGSILSFTTGLLIPIIVLYAYYADAFDAAARGEDPPEFPSIFQLSHTVDRGLWALSVVSMYVAIGFVPSYAVLSFFSTGGILYVFTLASVVYIIFTPVPLAVYGRTKSFRKAFQFPVLNLITSKAYITVISKILFIIFSTVLILELVLYFFITDVYIQFTVMAVIAPTMFASTFWLHMSAAYVIGTAIEDEYDW